MRPFLSMDYWLHWTGFGIALVLLVVLLVLMVRRRRDVKPTTAEPLVNKNSLRKIWRAFVTAMPREFQRSILLYKPYIVLGEPGSGKSQLINHYTDWKAQSHQFYPSYTRDAVLQLYLASKVIVQEISAALLHDTSQHARVALKRLWAPILNHTQPVVIVTLSAYAIRNGMSETLQKQAELLRGKLNLISTITRQPAQVKMVITFTDQVAGFHVFHQFLSQQQLPQVLFDGSVKQEEAFNEYEPYLQTALLTLSTKDYINFIGFLLNGEKLLRQANAFAQLMTRPEPLSTPPIIENIQFFGQGMAASGQNNPFIPHLVTQSRRYRPLLKHQIAAGMLLVLGLGYLFSGFFYAKNFLAQELAELSTPGHGSNFKVITAANENLILNVLPTYQYELVKSTRDALLIHSVQDYLQLKQQDKNLLWRYLYLPSLYYATRNNTLGRMVKENPEDWSRYTGLPVDVVKQYVKLNKKKVSDDAIFTVGPQITVEEIAYDDQVLKTTIYRTKTWLDRAYLQPKTLTELQGKVAELQKVIVRIEISTKSYGLLRSLEQDGRFILPVMDIGHSQEIIQDIKNIKEYFNFLSSLDLVIPNANALSLLDVLAYCETLPLKHYPPARVFTFRIFGPDINSHDWLKLIDRSKISLFLRAYQRQNVRRKQRILFQAPDQYAAIRLNPNNDGSLFFTGKARIDGIYTKAAYDQEVQPILARLPKWLKAMPIHAEDKNRFTKFVQRTLARYAQQYAKSYWDYYYALGVSADTKMNVRFLLSQLGSTSSVLQQVLVNIAENTQLNFGDTAFYQRLQASLQAFAPIRQLVAGGKGVSPEWMKYQEILAQMQEDLESDVPPKPSVTHPLLEAKLSPFGRIGLAIFLDADNSYYHLVEDWTKSVGLDIKQRKIFLQIVNQAYRLGLSEVVSGVNGQWQTLIEQYIQPLEDKFPFNQQALDLISPDDLEQALHPKGDFWRDMEAYVMPVLHQQQGRWVLRNNALRGIQPLQAILPKLNAIAHMSDALWDEKGKQRRLTFQIQPMPLPPLDPEKAMAILAYLKIGAFSVFGFNQKPAWQTLEYAWWMPELAAVGVEFNVPGADNKMYKTIEVEPTYWGFYKLLQQADVSDEKQLTWNITPPQVKAHFYSGWFGDAQAKPASVPLQFKVREDPWRRFQDIKFAAQN